MSEKRKPPSTAFKPGQSGNPRGKPKGAINRTTRLALELFEGGINHTMSNKVKVLYLVLTVILPYIKRKLSGFLIKDATGWKSKLLNILNLTDKILSALSLINLSVFIYDGKYRNLTQRIMSIPMKFILGESARILDFTLMNRKIIWHIYELFLKPILPYAHEYWLINIVCLDRLSRTYFT